MSELNLKAEQKIDSVENFEFEPIKGYPRLRWQGKRGFTSTQYYPAQLKESFGEETDGWMNKIFWGDNLQVMSHLLKKYRGQVDLIYIDPPFDSKADYKLTIELKGSEIKNDNNTFEEKQYTDIWTNDEYLQFMYERLVLMRELLSEHGSIFLHCDWHKIHLLRCIMDELFGSENLRNEIIWCYTGPGSPGMKQFNRKHDNILWYSKGGNWTFNGDSVRVESEVHSGGFQGLMDNSVSDEYSSKGKIPEDWWEFAVASRFKVDGNNRTGYPTEKPFKLLSRIIEASSNPGDLVFDCFMGGGTCQAVAMKLGRRFLGADINMGAIDTTVSRLLRIKKEIMKQEEGIINYEEVGRLKYYTGFELYNVNNYDVFRNPVEAKNLLTQALELQPLPNNELYDGEKDGRMIKIMPINRIATRADLNELISNFNLKLFDKRKDENPNKPVELITLVCMGHEPDLAGHLELEMKKLGYTIDVEVLDILTDRKDLEFKRDAEADINIEGNKLVIRDFYPMNLLSKLSMQAEEIEDWRALVSSIKIDFYYDNAVFSPSVVDVPEKKEIVKGVYVIPKDAKRIRIKITDVLSESFEKTIEI